MPTAAAWKTSRESYTNAKLQVSRLKPAHIEGLVGSALMKLQKRTLANQR